MASKYDEMVNEISNIFYEAIKNDTQPWTKPWKADDFKSQAHNPVTKTVYQGMNSLLLDTTRYSKGYENNSWLTYNQVKNLGGNVMKGEKSSPITYYNMVEKKVDIPKDLDFTPEKEYQAVFKKMSVFNIAQTENIPKEKLEELTKSSKEVEKTNFTSIEDCEKILKNVDVSIRHLEGKKAFYSPTNDEITLPLKEQFINAESYYSTAFHELGHSTGHESRLNRDLKNAFGTEKYAKEELRAEIYSFLQAKELGIDYNLENHQSYVKSWTKNLKDDKKEIYLAVRDSIKIVEFVKENYIEKALGKEKSKDIDKPKNQEAIKEKKAFKPKEKVKSKDIER